VPEVTRVGDIGKVDKDAHGCPACPHSAKGPAIVGSDNVLTNSLPTVRVDDKGIHMPCCGPNMWTAPKGSGTVFVNGKKIHRKGDKQAHCGGNGESDAGSDNVDAGG